MAQDQLHPHQNTIISKLTLGPLEGMRFSELLIENISTDHVNYHLKELVRTGMVEKVNIRYRLTDRGKDYSGRLDDELKFVEKQPKASVILWIVRKNKEGKNEYLLNKRLRHPHYGKVGWLTGKIRYGETLEHAAQRELLEETGLRAGFIKLNQIYHRVRKRPQGEVILDNVFFVYFIKNLKGRLKKKIDCQENFWVSVDDIRKHKYNFYHDFYKEYITDERYDPHDKIVFIESSRISEGY